MSFNPDLNKQAQEVIFSRKMTKWSHPPVFFNDIPVSCVSFQKHLGIYPDEKLNFNHHIKEKMTKAMKGIGVIKRLSKMLPRHSLLTIYKSFVRPHLDYGDILYDQPNNKSFCQKIETVQYNAALAITGAIKGTSQIKLYNELGLESLEFRWWFRKLCLFYKIKKNWFTRIYSQYDTTKQPSVQHSVNWGCCNFLLQNRCIPIFLFPTYHFRIEQTWYANKKIKILFVF